MEAVSSAAEFVVRHSTAAIEEVSRLATARDPLAWLAGDDASGEEGEDVEELPPLALIPVPLCALQPWGDFSSDPQSDPHQLGSRHNPADVAEYEGVAGGSGSSPRRSPLPWRPDPALNARLSLWAGNLCALEVDALVVPTAAGFTVGASTVFKRVLRQGGRDLRTELSHLEACRSGEARLCKAYDMNCRKLVMTVGPKYKEKYYIAAENTLNQCYREAFQLLVEAKLASVAIPCLWYHKGYPSDEQAHVALRTVRRCMEHLPMVENVVFVACSTEEMNIYEALLPYYFPRTMQEAAGAERLPDCCWDEWGEIAVEERRIRVGPLISSGENDGEEDRGEPLFPCDDRGLLDAREDADTSAVRRLHSTMFGAEDMEEAKRAFMRYMRRARELPNESFDTRFVFRNEASASAPRRAVVLLGARIPALGVQDERTLGLFVKELELLRGERFALFYFNTCVDDLDSAKLEVLQEMLTVICARYESALDFVAVVHPGLWFRATFLWGRVVSRLAARAWNDTVYVERLADIPQYGVSVESLGLPDYVRELDRSLG